MKLIWAIILCLPFVANSTIYSLKDKKEISESEFLNSIPTDQFNIVLGEHHYNLIIQNNQAKIIKKIVNFQNLNNAFSLGWEFFEYKYQSDLDLALNSYKAGDISWDQFILRAIPGSSNTHIEYKTIIDAVVNLDGQLIATNASRSVKKNLMDIGESSLDINDTPSIWFKATSDYFKRFEIAMGGHADPITLKKYFLAQHYTDAIISSKINEYARYKHRFLVIGAFHSDFFDGVNRYLKGNNVLLKFVDRSLYSKLEWTKLIEDNSNFGQVADYLIY
jgi:uncharacterized iron-regulated protein